MKGNKELEMRMGNHRWLTMLIDKERESTATIHTGFDVFFSPLDLHSNVIYLCPAVLQGFLFSFLYPSSSIQETKKTIKKNG